MQRPKSCPAVLTLLLWSLLSGCAIVSAPRGWLPKAQETPTDVYGGWVELHYSSAGERERLRGELIALSADSIYVADEALHVVARADLQRAQLVAYESEAGKLGGLVALGTLSTASHGFVSVLTAPVWILFGGAMAVVQSYKPVVAFPSSKLERFAPFARYPKGMPAGLDRGQVKMRLVSRIRG